MQNAEIAAMIEEVRETKTIAVAAMKAFPIIEAQVVAMRSMIEGMKLDLASGSVVSAKDMSDLDAAAKDLHETTKQLHDAIPAGTVDNPDAPLPPAEPVPVQADVPAAVDPAVEPAAAVPVVAPPSEPPPPPEAA